MAQRVEQASQQELVAAIESLRQLLVERLASIDERIASAGVMGGMEVEKWLAIEKSPPQPTVDTFLGLKLGTPYQVVVAKCGFPAKIDGSLLQEMVAWYPDPSRQGEDLERCHFYLGFTAGILTYFERNG